MTDQPEMEEKVPVEPTPFDEFVEHQKRALDETGKAIESLLPPDFVEHSKKASKEFAAGFKVLTDAVIGEFEKVAKKTEPEADDDTPPSTTGKTKVKVQVD